MPFYLEQNPDGPLRVGPLRTAPVAGRMAIEVPVTLQPLYLEPDPTGHFTTDYATSTLTDGMVSAAIPTRLAPVPTLEATHTFDGQLQLHDHRELGTEVPWRLRCRRISLGSMPAIVQPADPRVGGTGTIGRRGRVSGRVVTYSGAIQAVDAKALREASAALLQLGWDQETDRTITIDQDDAGWAFTGRVVPDVADNVDLPLSAVPTPYQAEFTVAVQMNDPRIYAQGTVTDLAVISTAPPADAAVLPWPRLPVVLRPPLPLTGTGTVEILGRIPTPPILRVHGPRAGITLTDVARDVQLVLDLDIPDGAWIDIDLRGPSITTSDGQDVRDALRWPDSTWWMGRNLAVPVGPLQLQITSLTAGPGADVDVIHHPAYP